MLSARVCSGKNGKLVVIVDVMMAGVGARSQSYTVVIALKIESQARLCLPDATTSVRSVPGAELVYVLKPA